MSSLDSGRLATWWRSSIMVERLVVCQDVEGSSPFVIAKREVAGSIPAPGAERLGVAQFGRAPSVHAKSRKGVQVKEGT